MTNPTSSAATLPPELGPLQEDDPARIGKFQVVGRLGAGGMGAVYGALDSSGTCVAVKVIHPAYAADSDYRERFAIEVDLVREVRATCTAAFLGADPDAEQPWLATEFVPGRTLRQHVAEHGPLTDTALWAFAAGSAEALAAIHAAGIVHRDIKPGNLILSPDGPKLLDFGIAKFTEQPDDSGALMGTPGWLAPEQYAGVQATPASDMFAWGGLVAFAATGRNPFGTGQARELAERTRTREPDLSGVPDELLPLVERAMAKDPAVRPRAEESARTILGPAAESADESGDPQPTELSSALGRVLRTAWRGFGSAGHAPANWQALLSQTLASGGHIGAETAVDTACETATAAGGKAAGAKATTGLGLSKSALATGAAVISAAAVATTVVATQMIPNTTGGEGSDGSTGGPNEQEEQEEQEDNENQADLREVEFQDVVLRIPEKWEVHEMEQEWFVLEGGQAPWTEGWLMLQTDPNESCDLSGGEYGGDYGCAHVRVYGPGAYDAGYLGDELNASTPYHPGMDPAPCAGQEATAVDPDAANPRNPPQPETADIGDRKVPYQAWTQVCMDMESKEILDYGQRVWYLQDAEVVIVDEWATDGLDDFLAESEA